MQPPRASCCAGAVVLSLSSSLDRSVCVCVCLFVSVFFPTLIVSADLKQRDTHPAERVEIYISWIRISRQLVTAHVLRGGVDARNACGWSHRGWTGVAGPLAPAAVLQASVSARTLESWKSARRHTRRTAALTTKCGASVMTPRR